MNTWQWVFNRGVRWKGREKERNNLKREKEKKGEREREVTSPSSSIDPSGVSWGCPHMWAWLEYLLQINVPTLEISVSLSMQIRNLVQSVPLDFSGNGLGMALGIFGGLNPLLQFMPTSQPHPCTCAVLCSSPGARTRTFVPEMCCPTSLWPLLQPHPPLSQGIITNNSWLLSPTIHSSIWLSLFETYTLALLSPRILQAVTFLQLWSVFVVVSVVRMFRVTSVVFVFMIAKIKITKFLRS